MHRERYDSAMCRSAASVYLATTSDIADRRHQSRGQTILEQEYIGAGCERRLPIAVLQHAEHNNASTRQDRTQLWQQLELVLCRHPDTPQYHIRAELRRQHKPLISINGHTANHDLFTSL